MLTALAVRGANAQERPRYGGELVYVVPTEPASYDGHREGTFALIHPLAPVYSTLLRFDPTDRTGTKVVGDLAPTLCGGIASSRTARRCAAGPSRPSHFVNNQLDGVWLSE